MRIRTTVVMGVCVLLVAVSAARAQNYPLPSPTDYSLPVKAFVGRFVDSTTTRDYQCCPVRTYRAKGVRVVPGRNRIYMMIGETFMAYNLSTFFSTTLPAGMSTVTRSSGGEKYLPPVAYVYPEDPKSNWRIYVIDGQKRLFDFDIDDRGNVYLAYSVYGWGIVKDTGGSSLPLQSQRIDVDSSTSYNSVLPRKIRVFSTGGSYYALVSDPGGSTTDLWNVTDVTNPSKVRTDPVPTVDAAVATSGGTTMVAAIQGPKTLSLYRGSSYASGGAASLVVPSAAGYYAGAIASDGTNFWVAESDGRGGNFMLTALRPASPGSTTYTVTHYSPSESVNPSGVTLGEGKLTILSTNGNMLMFDVSTGTPTFVDLGGFFQSFYKSAGESSLYDVSLAAISGKTYLFYSDRSLGDVYEMQGANQVSVSLNSSAGFGTANPNSTTSADRPFYGDPIPLKSAFSGATSVPNVTWDFGNPESGSANTATTSANATLSHQYAGIGTIGSTTLTKTVTITDTTNSADTDSLDVVMKRPSARVVLGGTSLAFPGSSTASANVVPGDKWYDGSDGSIESHYDVWGPDPNDPNAPTATSKPGTGFDVGSCGTHTLAFQPHYIPYDPNTITPVNSDPSTHYKPSFTPISYEVRPFWSVITIAASDPNNVTFENSARIGSSSIFGSGTSTPVTIDWKLMNGATQVDAVSHSSTIGTAATDTWQIPKSEIVAGYQVVVTMSVAPGASNVAACDTATYQTSTAQMTLNPPDPKITAPASCYANSPCTFTAGSVSGADISGWTMSWTGGPTSGSGATYSPTFTTANSYLVTLNASNAVGQASVSTTITVNPPACSPGLSGALLSVNFLGSAGCTISPCATPQAITFTAANPFFYTFQDCDSFSWNFGDGTSGSGRSVTHTFPANGPYNVKLTVSNSTGESATTTTTIQFGTVSSCPTQAPIQNKIFIGYSGSLSGCTAGGKACLTTDTILFSIQTFGYTVQSCDSALWTFGDGSSSTSKTPSHKYSTAGTYPVTLKVTNSMGSATVSANVTVNTGSTGSCQPGLSGADGLIVIGWTGEGGCTTSPCANNQPIDFSANAFYAGYTFQACDVFTWDFGDGNTDNTSGQNVTHTFAGSGPYTVTLNLTNSTSESASASPVTIQFAGGSVAKPTGVNFTYTPGSPIAGITVVNFSGSQSGGDPATTWKWTFGDGSSPAYGKNVTHTFANPQSYTVTLTATNGGGSTTASKTIAAVEDSGYSFMIPGVIHAGGANDSVWRSDFQAYVPNVSAANPLTLNLQFNGCVYTTPSACTPTQINKTMVVNSSTFVVEDFMASQIDPRGGSGSVIVTGNSPDLPQIWTRTYNLAPSGVGTYGQLVPAVLLSSQQNALLGAPEMNIGGLQQSTRFRTNLGFVNPNGTAITLTAHVFDSTGFEFGTPFAITLSPYQLDQRPMMVWYPALPSDIGEFSIRIDNPSGLPVIGYASQVDNTSNDPVYIPALSDAELSTESSRDVIIPSVGHFNTWRSDISIFNPDSKGNSYDITYFDSTGALRSQLLGVTIAGKGTLDISDVLKAGQLLPVISEDSIGEILVHSNLNPTVFPEVFGRTYSDQGTAGTFGYASPAFSVGKPNVVSGRPAYVPGVRNDANYYTNLGLISLNGTDSTTVLISMLDPVSGVAYWTRPFTLNPFSSTIIPSVIDKFLFNTTASARGTLKIEVISGGPVWAYATVIDKTTADPEYVPAIPAN